MHRLPRRAALVVEALEDRVVPTLGLPTSDLLVRFRDDLKQPVQPSTISVAASSALGDGLFKIELADDNLNAALRAYRADPRVLYAEPVQRVHTMLLPNDPRFDELFGLDNTGQTGGTANADIDAPQAWDVTIGSLDVVVGVIDTGIDYTHPDLYLNVWINQAEIPVAIRALLADADGDNRITFWDLNHDANDGRVVDRNRNGFIDAGDLLHNRSGWEDQLDNDANGFRDDLIGWDFVNDDNDPFDDNEHGTHVAGTIGAVGNNDVGIVGVNWKVQLAALKFLDAGGSGTTDDAIRAVNYSVGLDMPITSNSWGGGGFSQGLFDAIAAAGANGQVFVAAAGNAGRDTDTAANFPSSYDLTNILSVAATDDADQLADFSNFGLTSVDLAAPGVDVLSTQPGGGYQLLSGTSMATPHVSGAVALLLSQHPDWDAGQLINNILNGVDPLESLDGFTLTGGRLNAFFALGPDGRGPRILSQNISVSAQPVSTIEVFFSEPIDPLSFTVDDVLLNEASVATNVEVVADSHDRRFRISFPEQSVKQTYTLRIGPDIVDKAATPNAMDQNRDGERGEAVDQYVGTFRIIEERVFAALDVPALILDNTTTVSTLVVAEDVSVAAVTVQLDLRHTFDGDLRIFLLGPGSDFATDDYVVLSNRNGSFGDNFENTIFDDTASRPIANGAAPFRGSFRPDQPLSAFAGINARGVWQLWIEDLAGLDEGALLSWSLRVEVSADAPPTPEPELTPTPNFAPILGADGPFATMEEVAVTVTVLDNDTDPENDPLTVSGIDASVGGLAVVNADNTVTFTPYPDFFGAASFSYIVDDGQGSGPRSATVTIDVAPVNDAPEATGDFEFVQFNTPLVFDGMGQNPPRLEVVGAFDIDDDPLTITWVGNARQGTVELIGGVVRFTPRDGFLGQASFAYEVSDGALTAMGSVELSVRSFYAISTTAPGTLVNSDGRRVSFDDSDILQLIVGANGAFSYALAFDGSDVGLRKASEDIDAFCYLPDGSLLLSTLGAFAVPGPDGDVITGSGEDVLHFTPDAFSGGGFTAGTWELFFDGSAAGLSRKTGNIDGVALLPDGRLLLSTAGTVVVGGVTAADTDLLAFTLPMTQGGGGVWELYFDGSDVGLSDGTGEDVAALFVQPAAGSGVPPTLYFATRGNFNVTGASGSNEDVVAFVPTSLGDNTTGKFGPGVVLRGARVGLFGASAGSRQTVFTDFQLDGFFLGLVPPPEFDVLPLTGRGRSLISL